MTAAIPLVLFAFYAALEDLGAGAGLVAVVASTPGWLLLAVAALLLAVRAVGAARAPGPRSARIARALVAAGGALVVGGVPASLLLRDARPLVAGEGLELPAGALPGLPPVRFGEVTVLPRGPHLLSKTVAIEAEVPGAAPVSLGLFPPASLGGWRFSVMRYGYAPVVGIESADGVRFPKAFVPIGRLAPPPEDAALVAWTPEANVMMGAGTFPPKLEDLLSPDGSDLHVFLRIVQGTLGGVRRDLRDPDAYRWLADGRLEDPVFLVEVFRGRGKIAEGPLRAGASFPFPGGALEIGREVGMWVELVAVRDPWLAAVLAGLALGAAGTLVHLARGIARATRAITTRAAAGRT